MCSVGRWAGRHARSVIHTHFLAVEEVVFIEVFFPPCRDQDGEVLALFVVFMDVTVFVWVFFTQRCFRLVVLIPYPFFSCSIAFSSYIFQKMIGDYISVFHHCSGLGEKIILLKIYNDNDDRVWMHLLNMNRSDNLSHSRNKWTVSRCAVCLSLHSVLSLLPVLHGRARLWPTQTVVTGKIKKPIFCQKRFFYTSLKQKGREHWLNKQYINWQQCDVFNLPTATGCPS